jgi:hypothetical protein
MAWFYIYSLLWKHIKKIGNFWKMDVSGKWHFVFIFIYYMKWQYSFSQNANMFACATQLDKYVAMRGTQPFFECTKLMNKRAKKASNFRAKLV